MQVLRTPEDRFSELVGFDWPTRYVELAGDVGLAGDAGLAGDVGGVVRMAYVDEGPADSPVVVLLHGEPSWSYLYRKMIQPLLDAGFRVVAPDLIGFGRSDKPSQIEDYTYSRHTAWLTEFLFDRLDLRSITLFCQDWGGLLGLRVVGQHPDRFARIVASNTFLPTGTHPGDAFMAWRTFASTTENFPIGAIVRGGCATPISDADVAAYDAPFPSEEYKAGARAFPLLVPLSHDDPEALINLEAWKSLRQFDRPFLCAFGDSDPVTKNNQVPLIDRIPGAAGRDHQVLAGGGHFIQEDLGPEMAQIIIEFVGSTS